jgi:SAM-dependent methyltransferase
MNITLEFYDKNANNFVVNTQNVNFKRTQDRFAKQIKTGGRILDFGCGSGRDTKYFMECGYCVDAVDGSEKICKIASAFIGSPVQKMLFQELEAVGLYDGIIYTSFKYGTFEGERNGRYFTDFTEETFSDFLKNIPEISMEELWITNDVRPDRGEEKWLNLILRKLDTV